MLSRVIRTTFRPGARYFATTTGAAHGGVFGDQAQVSTSEKAAREKLRVHENKDDLDTATKSMKLTAATHLMQTGAEPTAKDLPELILIGSIGAVAHCSHLQWTLFNQALREVMKDDSLEWDKQSYIDSLVATGGKTRLKAYLRNLEGPNLSAELTSDENIKKVYDRKTELFVGAIKKAKENGSVRIRPGIVELLRAAKDAGIKTGFCTTTVESVMTAFVETFELQDLFDFTFHEGCLPEIGYKGKPEPDCYLHAVRKILGENAVSTTEHKVLRNVIAFEDTQISMESPVRAGIPCVAFPSEWAVQQDFSKSVITVSEPPALAGFADGVVGEGYAENYIQALAGLCAKAKAAEDAKAIVQE